jgi:acyl-CoA reductase-like NAD-dependent aldehyde dehydrogenase
MRLEHLLAGERRPGGGAVELRAAFGGGPTLARLPRARSDDLADALAALRVPSAPPPRDLLSDALSRLAGDRDVHAVTARAAGLTEAELAPHRDDLAERAGCELPGPAHAGPGGVSVVAPDWSELYVGTARAVLHELARGHAVLLLPDARLPFAADALAGALLEAGLSPASLAVLHGAEEELLLSALAAPAVRAAVVSGEPRRIASVRRLAETRTDLEQTLDVPRGRTFAVAAADDLAGAARDVVTAAFGRARTLSGQLPGQVTRVFVARPVFARFGEELLAVHDVDPDCADPVPPVDRAATERWRAALALGLDEGATLVRGEEQRGAGPRPAIFTNVDPASRLARQPYPKPLLALIRGE